MLKSDLDSPTTMRCIAASQYECLRQARRAIMRIDIRLDGPNRINYNSALQWIDFAIEELTFED